jgi:hypothetical protein
VTPWSLVPTVDFVQEFPVTVGVHALPETIVGVGGKLAFTCHTPHWFSFQDKIIAIAEVVKH